MIPIKRGDLVHISFPGNESYLPVEVDTEVEAVTKSLDSVFLAVKPFVLLDTNDILYEVWGLEIKGNFCNPVGIDAPMLISVLPPLNSPESERGVLATAKALLEYALREKLSFQITDCYEGVNHSDALMVSVENRFELDVEHDSVRFYREGKHLGNTLCNSKQPVEYLASLCNPSD